MANNYIPATQVTSPRRHWSLIAVLEDGGPGEAALAIGRWDNQPRLAMRWNGDDSENPIGNPQSRGLPTWFVLPNEYIECVLSRLPEDKLTLARNFFPKPKKSAA